MTTVSRRRDGSDGVDRHHLKQVRTSDSDVVHQLIAKEE